MVTSDQLMILVIVLVTVGLFLLGRWRHDIVAMAALLSSVVVGLVAPAEAFSGFSHPAVVTVACVLILSRGLQESGAIDVLMRKVIPAGRSRFASVAALVGLGALLSGFMNNVGAMALLMPVAISLARRLDLAPSQVLMPLAFGTILGGMTTLVGTPPNLIVSGFRAETSIGESFKMFDFTAVGAAVAIGGVIFIVTLGWRLVPARRPEGLEGFDSGAYLTEARVKSGSSSEGKTLRELDDELEESGAQIVGLIRNDMHLIAPLSSLKVRQDDILEIEADASTLANVLSDLGLRLEDAVVTAEEESKKEAPALPEEPATSLEQEDVEGVRSESESSRSSVAEGEATEPESSAPDEAELMTEDSDGSGKRRTASSEVVLIELAVLPGSSLTGRSARDLLIRGRYRLNLLALSRQERRSTTRLRSTPLRAGDLLLMQGAADGILEFASDNGCVPLAERDLRIPDRRRALKAAVIMLISMAGAALGLLPAAISFSMGVLCSMVLRTIPPRSVYSAVDWPVIVLLAGLIPVAGAMQSTGAADLIAGFMLDHVAQGHAVTALAIVLLATMFLSDVMNNAATAAVMCPIAMGTADALDVGSDPFLMAVAIGASCAFLTPIGHQNNTLILGAGGLRFGDYWRLGLPLEILVAVIALPLLLVVWPL